MNPIIEESQRKAARVVGACYLFAMAAAIFSESFVRGRLMAGDDVMRTAQNIMAHQTLFRVGIAVELLTFAADIALIIGLYVILRPISRNLALFATAIRLAAEASFVSMAAGSLDVLRILSGADYLRAFGPDQLAALARLSLGSHAAAYGAGFMFLGLGSTVFAWLWVKTQYVPKAFGHLGIVASALLALGSLEMIVMPELRTLIYPWYMVPMFFFEVGLGLWLLVKGLKPLHGVEGRGLLRSSAAISGASSL